MAFKYHDSLNGNSHPVLVKVIIFDGAAMQPGEMVTTAANGFAEALGAGEAIFGVVHAVVDKYGKGVAPEKDSTASLGTGTLSSGVFTASTANEATDKVAVLVDVDPYSRYSGDVTGTIGTTPTTTGAYIGTMFEVASGGLTITETSGHRSTLQQLYSWGTDPNDSGNLIVNIKESEVFSQGTGLAQAT